MTPVRKLPKSAAKASPSRATAKTAVRRYKSAVFEAVHRSAAALHEVGAMDPQTMRNFDIACIEAPVDWDKKKIQRLRQRFSMSQPVFAAYLNSTPSTIAQWESGAKRPSNIAAKLLHVFAKHGPEFLR
jgi:putative transcriptional regulator